SDLGGREGIAEIFEDRRGGEDRAHPIAGAAEQPAHHEAALAEEQPVGSPAPRRAVVGDARVVRIFDAHRLPCWHGLPALTMERSVLASRAVTTLSSTRSGHAALREVARR